MIKRDTKDILEHVRVIKEHYINNNNETEVNPDILAEDLDLLVFDKNLEEVSLILEKKVLGVLVKSPKNRPMIFLDKNLEENQRKLTLFHEIGHYLLHWGMDVEYGKDDKMEVVFRTDIINIDYDEYSYENQANIFATHLMYNKEVIEDNKSKLNKQEQLYKALYEKFTSQYSD